MSQLKQTQKAKLFHVLKVVFYLLGLPLFFIAVFCTAIKFIGVEPFVGLSTSSFSSGVFVGYERFITSPALYGIWCAFAIWAFITICHFVLAKFVKNGKLRMFAVIAIILVVMFGTMGIMDAAFESQIGKIADGAPTGVTVQDYKSQLSYYDYVSYGRKDNSLINQLTDKVAQYEDVYNIKWQGIDKSGEAGNIANKPVTYANIIDDEGNQGAEDKSDKLVEKEPQNGKLVIDGKTYSNYFYITRTAASGTKCYIWYSKQLVPAGYDWNGKKGKMTFNQQDGIYGKGLYNENGMLSDGWIFSFENMLEILEDYYEGQAYVKAHSSATDKANIARIKAEAINQQKAYYTGEGADPYLKTLFGQEATFANNFSMPQERLQEVVSLLGGMLGDNALFDWALLDGNLSGLLGIAGGAIGGMIPIPGMNTIISSWVPALTGNGATLSALLGALNLTNLQPQVLTAIQNTYNNDPTHAEAQVTLTDVLFKLIYKAEGDGRGGLVLEVRNADGTVLLADAKLDANMTLSKLGPVLSGVLDSLVEQLGLKEVLDLVGGLAFQNVTVEGKTYKGIEIGGSVVPLIDDAGKFVIDVEAILTNVLKGLYSYQSPVIKPVWEFYSQAVEALYGEKDKEKTSKKYAEYIANVELASYLTTYERANYEATVCGGIMGSTLVGDTLGAGTYPAALGLTDLASVQQLKTDLSYQPKNFPLYAFRDMLLVFTGIVMLFYFLSFVAAEKERKYLAEANGESVETEGAEAPAKKPAFGKLGAVLTASGKKASLGRKITTYVLYALAFLPLLIVGIVIAAKSAAILPQYSAMHFIGFIILLVLAIVYAVVVILLTRKASKSSTTSKTVRIGITYVCLTAVLALLFTYVLPDAVAKATSSTMWVEDMFNKPLTQVEENATLEHDYVTNNLLNGNLNKYNSDGTLAEKGDFSYYGLSKHTATESGLPSDFTYAVEDIESKTKAYMFKDPTLRNPKTKGNYKLLKDLDKTIADLGTRKAYLYNYIYNNYVLLDPAFSFAVEDDTKGTPVIEVVARRSLALAITDYVWDNAGYDKLLDKGLKDAKVKQLFDNNYDSFNQDGYKPLDDPLLLFAQLDGRMTVPVIVRLILNKGWMYSQPQEDGTYDEANSFLYEMYDPETVEAYKAEHADAFTEEGELVDGNGKTYKVKYAVNEDGWKLYENGVVRRPVKWLVLDMLGTPMDLASLNLPSNIVSLFPNLAGTGVFNALNGLLDEDVTGLVADLTDGAGLKVGIYLDDNGALNIQLLPMSVTYGMLGYMQATWIQSNGLLMAVINVMALRNYLFIFAGVGLFIILLAGFVLELEKKSSAAPETTEGEAEGDAPTEDAATEA